MARGLGKGIEALLPTNISIDKLLGGLEVQDISVLKVTPNPDQPRRTISETQLAELSHSIKEHGVLQPLLVVRQGDGYMVVAGERRLRASVKADLKTVPCIVKTMTELQQLQVALIENVQREDLNAVEQAESIRRLYEDFNQSYEDIAKSLGKSYAAVVNTMRLLKLPAAAQESIIKGDISEGHGRAVLALAKFPGEQERLHKLIVQNNWSVRRAEQYAKDVKTSTGTKPQAAVRNSKYITNDWTNNLASKINAKVQINPMAKGGFIKISYKNDQELERLQSELGAK